MEDIVLPITRVQKSVQTKQKIIDAAQKLLGQYGYEQLTVRNVCRLAGVSNGTFYHFFNSKDDLMAEYLRQARKISVQDSAEIGLLEYIVRIYLSLTDNYLKMGLEFTSSYYSPKNQAFNVYTRKPGGFMQDLYQKKLVEAQQEGLIYQDLPVEMVVHDIQVIVIGNTFDWCVSNGISDLKHNMERMLRHYLERIFTEEFFRRYPKS